MSQRRDDLTLRHFARIVDSSDDAIVSKDLNGVILSWNTAAETMFGYTAKEAIGQSIRMVIPQDRQQEEDFVLSKIRAGEAVRHYETIRQRKDGTLFPISLSVSPIYDDHGNVIAASKIARDISDRKRADVASRRLAAVVQSSDDAIVTKDLNGIITSWNPAAERMFGYTSAEAIGKSIRIIIPADLQGEEETVLSRIRAGVGVDHFETMRQRKDGSSIAISLSVSPIFDDHGVVVGASKIARDVTVNRRLRAVAEEQMRRADRMKEEFFAMLSHELRTPLSAIVGYARLLRGKLITGDKAERGLDALERNAAALTQIIEDVLDVSRISSGKLRLDVQSVDLPLVVHNAVATVQPAADAKDIRLHSVIDPGVGPVTGDPGRLQQVVWNLLSNAVKFTPKRGYVQVRVERVNSHVEIVVSDSGIGIASDALPHVFERFWQADAGMTRKAGGLGLGLSIVHHLVELHGGSVDVMSAGVGQGATFRVRLPVRIVHAEPASEQHEHPRTEQAAKLSTLSNLSGIRVLSVDDDRDALELLRIVLETAGAHVVGISSAAEALRAIDAAKPDVLLVDLGMPDMNGFDFIARVRASSNLDVRDTPAAALTAFARSEDRTRALSSGFEMHLAKPIDPGELVASVARLARRAKSR